MKIPRWLLLMGVFGLALAPRLLYLGKTLEGDEMATAAWAMSKNFSELFELLFYKNEGNAAGYPLFMFFWGKIALSEIWLRLPSVIGGAFCVTLFFHYCSGVFSVTAALIAATQLSFASLLLEHSQNARGYSIWALLALLCLTYQKEILKEPTRRKLLTYALVCACFLYWHHFSILYLMPLWSQQIWKKTPGKPRWNVLWAPALTLVLYLPHIPLLWFQLQNGPRWIWPLTWTGFWESIQKLVFMHHHFPSAIVAIFALLGIFAEGKKRRLEIFWLSFPIAIGVFLSIFVREVFLEKYFLPSALGIFFFSAAGLQWVAAKSQIFEHLVIILLVYGSVETLRGLPSYYSNPKNADWRGVFEFVSKEREHCLSATRIVTDPYTSKRWPFYFREPYVVESWERGFPAEPFWLVGAGQPELPPFQLGIGKRLGEPQWQGKDAVAFCIKPMR